jgi:hypothetical protein
MSNVKQYLKEKGYNLNDDKEFLRAFADVKINLQASQEEFASAVGITSRTIRNKIAKDRAYYNACLEEFSSQAQEQEGLSEEELSKFVDNVIKLGTNPKSAKDIQVFIDFFEITKQDVKNIIEMRKSSLRAWVKDASIDYMDRRNIATVLDSMDVLYQGTKDTVGATDKFINMDIEDDLTKLRLMYAGLLFMSLWNQVEHPDLEYLGTLVRLEQVKQGRAKKPNTKNIKELSNIQSSKMPEEQFTALLKSELGLTDEQIQSFLNAPKKQSKLELPSKEQVQIEAKHYRAELDVFLSAQEEIENMIKGDM